MAATIPFPVIHAGDGNKYQPIAPACPSTLSISSTDKPRVFLTTVRISDDHIWANGLFQNIYVIYKMLEIAGLEPWLFVDNNDNNKDAKLHHNFRMTDFKTYSQQPFRIAAYVEMGMSCDPGIRKFFRSMGAKVSKLYLGNILNIDIETITFYPSVNFSHHVAGEIDEIWVSPHYDIHADYAGAVNALCGKTRVAPYVWEPLFIEKLGHVYDSTGLTPTSPRLFVTMEPNISFQKNGLIPIMTMEAYYRKHPSLVGQIIAVNGVKFKDNAYFQHSVAPNLEIMKNNKLELMPRAHIINAAPAFKNAIILQHQVNNEYNYSFLEWITMGFPVVHNVKRFKEYGYYYEADDFDAAAAQIEYITKYHDANVEAYKAHVKQLTWRFSIYNPENIQAWKKLVLEK
jgi:hypothetical protein